MKRSSSSLMPSERSDSCSSLEAKRQKRQKIRLGLRATVCGLASVAVTILLVTNLWLQKRLLKRDRFSSSAPPLFKKDPSGIRSSSKKSENVDFDKEPIYEILRHHGVKMEELDVETRRRLPTWSTIQRLYGDRPVIHGLETCERFREVTDPTTRYYAIAGNFNTGTNLLSKLLIENCQHTKRKEKYGAQQKGMRWQVPWGKHTPVRYRGKHKIPDEVYANVSLSFTLPMVTIRDPFYWMASMCRNHYKVFWKHTPELCPHVILSEGDLSHLELDNTTQLNPIRVEYRHSTEHHKSLPHFWTEWYQEYLDVDFPRIMVRLEDLVFHTQNVTETLCRCGGGDPLKTEFQYVWDISKFGETGIETKTSIVEALVKYGTEADRIAGLRNEEIPVTNDILDDRLMKLFRYQHARVPSSQS